MKKQNTYLQQKFELDMGTGIGCENDIYFF